MTVLKVSKLQGFVWKPCERDWMANTSSKHFQLSAAVAIATFEILDKKFSGNLILILSFSLY